MNIAEVVARAQERRKKEHVGQTMRDIWRYRTPRPLQPLFRVQEEFVCVESVPDVSAKELGYSSWKPIRQRYVLRWWHIPLTYWREIGPQKDTPKDSVS